MNEVRLPELSADASIEDALESMIASKCSAVVVVGRSARRILDVEELTEAGLRADTPTVGSLRPRARALDFVPKPPSSVVAESQRLDRAMDQRSGSVSIIASDGKFATVVTRYEFLASHFGNRPLLYACAGPAAHYLTSSQIDPQSSKCPKHGKPTQLR
jgi:hypothetical protein